MYSLNIIKIIINSTTSMVADKNKNVVENVFYLMYFFDLLDTLLNFHTHNSG